MTAQPKSTIKSYFETGDKPTQSQFVDLVDSYKDAFTTLPVSEGGTGLNTLTANGLILGNGTSNPTFLVGGATGHAPRWNGTTWVSQFGSADVKAWATVNNSGSASLQSPSFGVSGVVRDSTGTTTITFSTAFSSGDFTVIVSLQGVSGFVFAGSRTATTVQIVTSNTSNVVTDYGYHIVVLGNQ